MEVEQSPRAPGYLSWHQHNPQAYQEGGAGADHRLGAIVERRALHHDRTLAHHHDVHPAQHGPHRERWWGGRPKTIPARLTKLRAMLGFGVTGPQINMNAVTTAS